MLGFRHLSPRFLMALSLGAASTLAACGKGDDGGGQQKTQAPPAAVDVVTLKEQPVSLMTELPGRISAYRVADVRPQVSGVVLKRLFVEGTDVKQGQQLYQIDPAPYQAALDSAKATLLKAQAGVISAQATATRYKTLTQVSAISKQDYDNAVATLAQDQADVASARASIETAAINVAYTKVYAPISGRTGRSSVTEGALVTANQTTSLVTVQTLDPVYVDVTQPATTLLRLKKELASGSIKSSGDNQASVNLVLEDGSQYDLPGKLEFSEVSVDQSTGSVTLRATFPNPGGLLLPGMFVREKLEEGVDQHGILVPQQGVTHASDGTATALLVDGESKVQLRKIKADRAIGDKWLVTGGLKAGDRVIVVGLQKVQPGAKVQATDVAPDDIAKLPPVGQPANAPQH